MNSKYFRDYIESYNKVKCIKVFDEKIDWGQSRNLLFYMYEDSDNKKHMSCMYIRTSDHKRWKIRNDTIDELLNN